MKNVTMTMGALCLLLAACGDVSRLDAEAVDNSAMITNAIQTRTVDGASGGSITGAQGTTLDFAANSFRDADGNLVTGSVDISLIEAYDRASMLMMNRATMGTTPEGERAVLVSGGEFFVEARQDGQALTLAQPFQLSAPVANTAEQPDLDMQVFRNAATDCESDNCLFDDVDWEQADPMAGNQGVRLGEFPGGLTYMTDIGEFGWTNLDRWYSDPREQTQFYVEPPEGLTGENASVFISYDGEPSVLALLDVYDQDQGLFTEHYGLLPIGLEIHVIMTTEIDEQLHYAIQAVTVEADQVVTIDSVEPVEASELNTLINDLP